MQIEPTATGSLTGGVSSARQATMRDPTLAAIAVLLTDITETGATLRSPDTLPKDTLVSLGLAGAGRVLARIVRAMPGAMAAEFTTPLDARQMRRLATVDTLAAVATPQRSVDRAAAASAPVAVAIGALDRPVALPHGEAVPGTALVYGVGGGLVRAVPDLPIDVPHAVDARERMPFGPVTARAETAPGGSGGLRWAVLLILAATLVYLLA